MEKPQRPYKSFEEYRTSGLPVGFDSGGWPCTQCRGLGCEACNNTGLGTKEDCKQAYKMIIDEWKKDVEVYKAYKAILTKLTKQEIEILKAVGI